MIQRVTKWSHNGVQYDTQEEAALAAFRHKLDISHEDVDFFDQKVKANASDLINLLSVFTRKVGRN